MGSLIDPPPRYRIHRNREDDNVRHLVKVEPPYFDGNLELNVFLDWSTVVDHYFEWSNIPDYLRVNFALLFLHGPNKLRWLNVECQQERVRLPPIDRWEEMVCRLKEKYIPTSYHQRLLDHFSGITQGSNSVDEYMTRFDKLLVRCNLDEDPSFTLACFKNGL